MAIEIDFGKPAGQESYDTDKQARFKNIILEALEDPEPMTDWEYDFIQNVAENDLDETVFSEKQQEVLEKIARRYE